MGSSRVRAAVALAGLLRGLVLSAGEAQPAPAGPVPPPAPLRYGWAQRAVHHYAVELEIDHGDEVETQKGTVVLTVTPVEDGQAVLSMPPLRLVSQRVRKPGRDPGGPWFGPPPIPRPPAIRAPMPGVFLGHEVTMDARGRIVSERGEGQLPFALGAFIPLVFQTLPEGVEARWQRTETVVIRTTAEGFFVSPLRPEVETGRYNAEEVTALEVRSLTDAHAELAWTHSLKTVQTVQGEPVMELTGAGTIVLNRSLGVPSEVKHTLRFCEREENREQRYPIRFSCVLLDDTALERRREQAEAARAAAEASRAPPTAEEREALLADLKSGDQTRARKALFSLQRKRPEKPDKAMAEAIADWLEKGDLHLRQQAAEALGEWGTRDAVPKLLKCLEGNGFDARAAARALGKLRESRAAPVLAGKLTDMGWRVDAAAALKAIGKPAEKPVSRLLQDRDWGVRLEACRILQEVGTQDSLESLEAAAARDENPLVRQAAGAAARAIRAR